MDFNEYQIQAQRTSNKKADNIDHILNGLMGLNGEAGECIDILKKYFFQGHEFGQEEKEIEHVDSELVEVGSFSFTTNYKKPEDCKNMKELYQLAKSRGYKPGWAYYQGKLRGFI